jgi:pyruvate dehydrogenase E1 component alpha subunit
MDSELRKRLLRDMLFARRFEEQCYQDYQVRKIGGFLHLYPGQEACAHGVMAAARPGDDYVITGYRDHVHALVCGVPAKEVMAELYGKATGSSSGFGGSMHIFDAERHFMGGYALVGGPFPLAAGLAMALKMQGSDAIAICFLGDAANNQGTFHETLNMASVWKLPVLFVCENNLYGIGTSIERSTAELDQYKRVSGYRIPSACADGQDVEAVFDAATVAVDYVREQRTPYFLELKTYRFRGHSMSDGGAYRTKDEIEEWRKKDPLELLLDRMVEAGEVTREEYAAMDEAILAEIEDEIVPFAEESPEPDPKDLTRFVFVEGDPWVHGGPGKEAQ